MEWPLPNEENKAHPIYVLMPSDLLINVSGVRQEYTIDHKYEDLIVVPLPSAPHNCVKSSSLPYFHSPVEHNLIKSIGYQDSLCPYQAQMAVQ